jgi:hypothetical protein
MNRKPSKSAAKSAKAARLLNGEYRIVATGTLVAHSSYGHSLRF